MYGSNIILGWAPYEFHLPTPLNNIDKLYNIKILYTRVQAVLYIQLPDQLNWLLLQQY